MRVRRNTSRWVRRASATAPRCCRASGRYAPPLAAAAHALLRALLYLSAVLSFLPARATHLLRVLIAGCLFQRCCLLALPAMPSCPYRCSAAVQRGDTAVLALRSSRTACPSPSSASPARRARPPSRWRSASARSSCRSARSRASRPERCSTVAGSPPAHSPVPAPLSSPSFRPSSCVRAAHAAPCELVWRRGSYRRRCVVWLVCGATDGSGRGSAIVEAAARAVAVASTGCSAELALPMKPAQISMCPLHVLLACARGGLRACWPLPLTRRVSYNQLHIR